MLANTLGLKIRTALSSDLPGLEAVINQHWKVNIDHSQELKNSNAVQLVAESGEANSRILGTALMWVTDWNKTGYLVELAVDNDSRRKGIGSSIIKELAARAVEKGLRSLIVETQLDNKDGMNFYLKSGFRLCGYNDRYYTNAPKTSHDIAIFFSLDL